MSAGQASSHALHVVQDHSSSSVISWNTSSEETVIPASTATGGDCGGVAVIDATVPSLRTISRGSRGLPVALAGHTAVHRPQIVQASVSRSCFHVNSPTVAAPIVSMSVASMRLGTAFIAPLGRSLGARARFTGVVIMWRSFVTGSTTRKPKNVATCATHIAWWMPEASELGIKVESG